MQKNISLYTAITISWPSGSVQGVYYIAYFLGSGYKI